jgi:hypothetical protein
VVPVTTFELGEMETLEMDGGLLLIVAEAEAESEPPYPSDVDAVQVNVPPTGAMLVLSVMLLPDPMVLPFMVQTYDTETDSPSGSLALEEQDTVEVGCGLVLDNVGVCTEGARFETVTEVDPESDPPLLSEVDATQETESVGLTL